MKNILFVFTFVILAMFAASCEFGTSADSTNIDSVNVNHDTLICVIDTVATDTLVQCKGITKKGIQCERLVLESEGYCFQHKPKK